MLWFSSSGASRAHSTYLVFSRLVQSSFRTSTFPSFASHFFRTGVMNVSSDALNTKLPLQNRTQLVAYAVKHAFSLEDS